MPALNPILNSLVLYKNRPARVSTLNDKKIEIILEDGQSTNVRPKDITVLHPGPFTQFQALQTQAGDVQTAWELLAGETTTLLDLAELIYGNYTPATAWAVWSMVEDGLYLQGSPEAIRVRTAEDVAQTQALRAAKAAEKLAWEAFLDRLRAGTYQTDDLPRLQEVIELALEQRSQSRILRELGHPETRESAHALLLAIRFWDETINPYPKRMQVDLSSPNIPLPALPEESRLDLTHLAAFAIDDAGITDPDDALSIEGDQLWVHVADASALVPPNSPADHEALARGANLYLPEETVSMLPKEVTEQLGLGLQPISPALSFKLTVDEEGTVQAVEIHPSWVQVTRLSYGEVETRLTQEPFVTLYQKARRFQWARKLNGAIPIGLPEVKVRVVAGDVQVIPLPSLKSRDMVQEAMLMVGQAVAQFAVDHAIPFPFATQEPPDNEILQGGMAGMFSRRRTMKRSQRKSVPAPHTGLGLPLYTQVTSPLRRYLDLVGHQQLRAYLRGEKMLDVTALMERVGASEAINQSLRQVERLSNQHWTLVYLHHRPDWRGEGVVVEKVGSRGVILIPELAWEFQFNSRDDLTLNQRIEVRLQGVNLPALEAHFHIR